jgi:hypothetical protein
MDPVFIILIWPIFVNINLKRQEETGIKPGYGQIHRIFGSQVYGEIDDLDIFCGIYRKF